MVIKAVGTKALRDRFTMYLREVRRGVKNLVLDHDRVIAELHEPTRAYSVPAAIDSVERWEPAGILRRGQAPRKPLAQSPVRLAAGTAQALLDAERREPSNPERKGER